MVTIKIRGCFYIDGDDIDCDWPTVVLLLDKNLIEVSEDCGKI